MHFRQSTSGIVSSDESKERYQLTHYRRFPCSPYPQCYLCLNKVCLHCLLSPRCIHLGTTTLGLLNVILNQLTT